MGTVRAGHHRATIGMRIVAPIIIGALFLSLWHFVAANGSVPANLLPAPSSVVHRLSHDLWRGQLVGRTAITIWESILGCLTATVFALPMGYLIARARLAEAAFSPYLAASQAIPAIAIAPLLVIWVGYGLLPIVLLCALIVFFPLLLATVLGLRSIDHDVIEAAELDGAAGCRMLIYIQAPLARAALLSGVRNGFTLSVTGAVVGEFVMGGEGLGLVLSTQAATADTTGLFSTLIVLCVLAMIIYLGLVILEKRTDPYRVPRHARGVVPEKEMALRLIRTAGQSGAIAAAQEGD